MVSLDFLFGDKSQLYNTFFNWLFIVMNTSDCTVLYIYDTYKQ